MALSTPAQLARLAEEQAALRRVATLVARGAPPAEVFEEVIGEVGRLVPADAAALSRYEPDDTLTTVGSWSRAGGYVPSGTRHALDSGTLARLIFDTRRPGRIDSYADVPGSLAAAVRDLGWRSSAGAPIIVEGRLWGVVAAASTTDRPLPPETEERIAKFAELVAAAIANAEGRAELTRLAEEQAAVRRVATLVAQGGSPAAVFEAVGAEIGPLVAADSAGVGRFENDGTVTALGGWARAGSYSVPAATRLAPERGSLAKLVFETGRPGRVDDYAEAPDGAAAVAREAGWRSSVGVPVFIEGRLWGLVAAASTTDRPLPADTEARLTEFTDVVASAIANAQGREEITRLAEKQAALRRVATRVAQGASPDEVFAAVAHEVAQVMQVPTVGVFRYHSDGATMTVVAEWSDRPHRFQPGTRWPLAGSPGTLAAASRESGLERSLGAPIVVDGRIWGVMAIASPDAPLPHRVEDRLAEFTELVATAIANAESREEVTRLADEQAALRRVATLVALNAPPVEVFEAVSAEVGRLVPADAAALSRYEADGTLTLIGGWSRAGGYDTVGTRWSVESTKLGKLIFETCRPGRIDTYADAPGAAAAVSRIGWRSSVGAPIVVDGHLWGVVGVGSTTELPLPPDTEARLAEFTELVATAIANTESREQLTRLAEEQAALRRVATLVAEGATPDEVFAAVADEVAQVIGVPLAEMTRYDDDGMATVLATSGVPQLYPVGSRWPIEGPSVTASVFETGRAARIDDYSHMHGTIADVIRESSDIRWAVGVPIVVDGALWGLMTAASGQPEPLPGQTEARLAKFTELVATAIANTESRSELAASRARIVATADATRQRIERDLHDGAQQQLVSLALELRAAQTAMPPELGELDAELSRVVQGLTSVMDELREMALGIHPAILAEDGLVPALKTLARRSAIPVELEIRAEARLPEAVEVAAYYVVSEALANAAKHAEASVVNIDVESLDRVLRVSVRDDGLGGADPQRGSGLLGLKDRAEAIGGRISLQSPPGAGTTLSVELPLDEQSSLAPPISH